MKIDEISTPSIEKIVKQTIKKSGFNADANASGGRCYEFADALSNNLKQYGYKPIKVDSGNWVSSVSKKLKHKVGWSEEANISENNHCWVICNGMHYDSLTPKGAPTATKLNYFLQTLRGYHLPDEEQQSYYLEKYKKKYNPKTDQFE